MKAWKVILSLIVVLTVASIMLLPFQGVVSAQTTNLAQGRPVTCSSVENAGTPCANAVDGNSGTRWSSAFSDPQWIYVDLGTTYTISRVVLNWETAYGRSYQIQVSGSASGPWTSIYSTTSGNGGTDDLSVLGSGRYVRMYGTARATQWGYSLWEFQVYGSSTPPPTTPPPTTPPPSGNLALNRPATSSSNENSSLIAARAVDGNTGTRWSSAFSDPQWIYVDLGATYSINRVVLNWEAAYGRSYQIQVSTNASTWASIYSTTSGNGGTDDLSVSGSGRYVRMYGTARATQWGYSLWEFQVYSGSAPPPTTPPPTTPPPPGWRLVWSDEFNGPSVDTSSWNFQTGCSGWGNNEWENYTSGANTVFQYDSRVGSNVLIIEARDVGGGACGYTSTRMNTQGKRSWQYGRMEARLALPSGKGLWPAFWMMGNSGGWPACGEIDIMEHINTEPQTHGVIHWDNNGHVQYGGTASVPNFTAYHVYAIEWDAAEIRWYVDNNNFVTANILNGINGTSEFHQPFYFLLNLAVGGAWPGYPDASTPFPARYYIDYVRVYQR